MALIEWNESLCLDIAVIDQQHRKLVDMINELNDAMCSGKGRDVLGRILNGLIAYAGSHFTTEEKYFAQLGYPQTEKHKAEHGGFVTKVSEFRQAFEAGRLGISTQVMNFLSDWLQGHIRGCDRKYVPFFHEKGIR